MDEYISREAVNDLIEDIRNNHFILMSDRVTLVLLKSKVAEIPTADVQPVKRGKWLHFNSDGIIFCSECKHEAYWDTDYGQQLFDYCPYCGARMIKDGEQNENN